MQKEGQGLQQASKKMPGNIYFGNQYVKLCFHWTLFDFDTPDVRF
jgi:hypothetical protein